MTSLPNSIAKILGIERILHLLWTNYACRIELCVLWLDMNNSFSSDVGIDTTLSDWKHTRGSRTRLRVWTVELAIPELRRELGRVSNFKQSINWHNHKKDHVQSCHLTKFDAFGVNRDEVIDLETWLKSIEMSVILRIRWR